MPKGQEYSYNSPLSEEHLDSINAAIEGLDILDQMITRTEMAEINVDVEKQNSADNRRRLLAIKRSFFPNA